MDWSHLVHVAESIAYAFSVVGLVAVAWTAFDMVLDRLRKIKHSE